jgi:hypothetical protein
MTFEQWWKDLTTREQHVIGYSNAQFVWEQARDACALILEQNAMACDNPIYRSLLQANARELREGRQDD